MMLAGFILTFAIFTRTIQSWEFGVFWLPITFAMAFAGFSVLIANFRYTKKCQNVRRRGEYLLSLLIGIFVATSLYFSFFKLGIIWFWLMPLWWLIVFIGIVHFGYRIWKLPRDNFHPKL